MNELALKQPRRILPRWRTFVTTTRMGELIPVPVARTEPASFENGSLLIERWRSGKIMGVAAEVLSFALLSGDGALAMEAAAFIEENRDRSLRRKSVEMLAEATMKTGGSPLDDWETARRYRPNTRTIGSLRSSLRISPRNPIAWAELSLLYAKIGRKREAYRCMLVAASLSPNDRFVLRSAARAFAHLQEHQTGLDILNRSGRTKEDPWLLAAQLALTQAVGQPQKLLRAGCTMSESGRFSPAQLSELNAAIGSVFSHGSLEKKANKHFRACLQQPTENAVCQVICDRKSEEFQVLAKARRPERNFESETRTLYEQLSLDKACSSARRWLVDEPFSARPALFGSFVAAVGLEDYEASIEFLKEGLTPNPQSPMLLNNMALSLARLGRVVEADSFVRKARQNSDGGEDSGIVLTATEGLVSFRAGNLADGRSKYEEAVGLALKSGRKSEHAMALVFWAREENDAGTSQAQMAEERAEEAVKKLASASRDVRIAMARLKAIRDERQ